MPFNSPALESKLLDMIKNPPPSPFEAGKKLGQAYAEFVKPALGAGSPGTFTGLEAFSLAAAAGASFQAPGLPPQSINGIVNGITAFWLAPPVTFGPAVTSLWTGQGVLISCLAAMANLRITEGLAAKKLVQCFDAATRLVFVQPPGPVPPVPLA